MNPYDGMTRPEITKILIDKIKEITKTTLELVEPIETIAGVTISDTLNKIQDSQFKLLDEIERLSKMCLWVKEPTDCIGCGGKREETYWENKLAKDNLLDKILNGFYKFLGGKT